MQQTFATSDTATKVLPSNYGKLVVKVWRQSSVTSSGNTNKWDYLVSATYQKGKNGKKVAYIRTTWHGGATLRNSASIGLGISKSGGSANAGSSWTCVKTKTKYWENSNGARSADYSSNIVVAPRKDYRRGTVWLENVGKVKLVGDKRSWSYSAAV